MVWLPQDGSGDPLSTRFDASRRQALREWVYRGGHLVIVLPEVGQRWSDSPLGDLMPVEKSRITSVKATLPAWAGLPTRDRPEVSMHRFDVSGRDGAEVVQAGPDGSAEIVARRYGMGRVTVIGLDLGSEAVGGVLDPANMHPVWSSVFGWRGPVYTEAYVAQEQNRGAIRPAEVLRQVELGGWIAQRLAMTGTVVPALLLAIVLFTAYWLAAGPGLFLLLKHKGLARWSWLGFVGVVSVFALLCWGGAALLKPTDQRIEHVTIVDLLMDEQVVQARTWMSVYVPRFGEAEVSFANSGEAEDEVDAAAPSADVPGMGPAFQTLASPGIQLDGNTSAYVDPRQYGVQSARPDRVTFPVRATSKQFVSSWLGPATALAWPLPTGKPVRGGPSGVAGTLVHRMPGRWVMSAWYLRRGARRTYGLPAWRGDGNRAKRSIWRCCPGSLWSATGRTCVSVSGAKKGCWGWWWIA